MKKFRAVLPHGSGIHPALNVDVFGDTRQQVLDSAWNRAVGSRYVSRILTEDGNTTLYTESGGWTEAAKAMLPQ